MLRLAKEYAPQDYYAWMMFVFRIVGLSPPQDRKKKALYLLLSIPNVIVCVVMLNLLECYILVRDLRKDLKTTLSNIYVAFLSSVISFRVYYWYSNRGKFAKIRSGIQRDTFHFRCFELRNVGSGKIPEIAERRALRRETSTYDDLGKLWATVEVTLNDERNQLDVYREDVMAQVRLVSCCLFVTILTVTLFTYLAAFWLAKSRKEYSRAYNSTFISEVYPNMVSLNFDIPLLRERGWLLGIYQVYGNCIRMVVYLPVMATITGTVLHLLGQTMVVNNAFRSVDKNIDPQQSQETVTLIKEIRFVKCVQELQEIYRLLKMVENFCSIQLLLYFGSLTVILCSSSYVITLVDDATEFTCTLIFDLAVIGDIFCFAYLCDTLSLELRDIMNSVYGLDWTSYPLGLRRKIVILMQRLQKRDILTVGKLLPLDLVFFVRVIQNSYAIYTLINNTRK